MWCNVQQWTALAASRAHWTMVERAVNATPAFGNDTLEKDFPCPLIRRNPATKKQIQEAFGQLSSSTKTKQEEKQVSLLEKFPCFTGIDAMISTHRRSCLVLLLPRSACSWERRRKHIWNTKSHIDLIQSWPILWIDQRKEEEMDQLHPILNRFNLGQSCWCPCFLRLSNRNVIRQALRISVEGWWQVNFNMIQNYINSYAFCSIYFGGSGLTNNIYLCTHPKIIGAQAGQNNNTGINTLLNLVYVWIRSISLWFMLYPRIRCLVTLCACTCYCHI